MDQAAMPDEIRRHYETAFDEHDRLRHGLGQLELLRTQEIVRRFMPADDLRILDVGGASGVHAEWLLADGHRVHLVDPVERHVRQATDRLGSHRRFSAAVGDGRALVEDDGSFDLVLLFGPLYHLVERTDRLTTWREAGRVVRSGGLVFGAAISRFASLFDGLSSLELFASETYGRIVEDDLATGQHRNPTGNPDWFTTAYLHRPDELQAEAAEAGLAVRAVLGVEGIAGWLPMLGPYWEDERSRDKILFSARATEAEAAVLGVSPHLIAVTETT